MKKSFIIISLIISAMFNLSANAQLRFGFKGGANFSTMRFEDGDVYDRNLPGFEAGIMFEYMFPIYGLGLEADALFSKQSYNWKEYHYNYISIPVLFKWKIDIPKINNIFRPFLTTGPGFDFLVHHCVHHSQFSGTRAAVVTWNFGLGFELIRHIQIAANFDLGLSEAYRSSIDGGLYKGRNYDKGYGRVWAVTAAYVF